MILDDYQDCARSYADWSSLPQVTIRFVHEHLEGQDLLAVLHEADIVVAMRERTTFSAQLFDQLPLLRLLVTTGMRNAAIDLDAALSHGVVVTGTPGIPTPTGELTWALILSMARNLTQETDGLRNGGSWQQSVGVDLAGKTLGLLGLGNIGLRVAKVGHAFAMNVIAWSPHLTAERAQAADVELVSRDAIFVKSDFLSIHLVLSPSTRHIIADRELSLMKNTAFLINTSRAGLLDTEALIHALRSHQIAGAGLDVFDIEPLPSGDILRSLPNVLATPHLGYVSQDSYRCFYKGALEDIQAWLKGTPIRVLSGT